MDGIQPTAGRANTAEDTAIASAKASAKGSSLLLPSFLESEDLKMISSPLAPLAFKFSTTF